MATEEQIKANERIVEAWKLDEGDEYTRCVLGSMLAESRNPNQRDYSGPMTRNLALHWAEIETHAVKDGHERCRYTAATLRHLARILHD